MARLENLLGVQALALVDRMDGVGALPSESSALVTLLAHPGHGVGWLAGVLGLTDSGATRLVERLVASGLVRRRPGTDARARTLTLTAAGRRAAEQVLAARADAMADGLATLSAAERRTLERLLGKVVSGLADDLPTAMRCCRLCDRDACGDGAPCPLQHTNPTGDLS